MGGRCKEGTTTDAAACSAMSNQRKGGTGTAVGRMTSEAEIEEFFTAMERGRAQRLKDKYNYDFERDEPMDGRYEWVEIQAGDEGRK